MTKLKLTTLGIEYSEALIVYIGLVSYVGVKEHEDSSSLDLIQELSLLIGVKSEEEAEEMLRDSTEELDGYIYLYSVKPLGKLLEEVDSQAHMFDFIDKKLMFE
jgi:hypothetical protein